MKVLIVVGVSVSLFMVSACAPKISYVAPVSTFATQAEKLGTAVATELTSFNTTRRIEYLRQDFFQGVRGKMSGSMSVGARLRNVEFYLCRPRKLSEEYSARSGYLNSVAASLKDVAGDPDKKTSELLKALLSSYDIDAPKAPVAGASIMCADDLANYYTTTYPTSQKEFAIPAAVEGVQALWKVFDTLAVAVLQQVDEARRAEALHSYFSDADNVSSLKLTIKNNADLLTESAQSKRHLDVRNSYRAYAKLEEKYMQVNIRKIPGCKRLLATPPQGALNQDEDFQVCFDDVWDTSQKEIAQFLEAAAAYDKDASRAPETAANELNKAVDTLADIATNKNVDTKRIGQMLEALINAASAISTLNDKLGEEETKKTISDALAKFKS